MQVKEMVILEEHAKAVQVASEALDLPLTSFSVRLHVTMRVECSADSIEAVDLDHALQLAKDINPREYRYSMEDCPQIEGDEIAYVYDLDGDLDEETTVDLRQEGEPYSWVACALVKKIAALEALDFKQCADIIEECKAACRKEAPEKI